MGKWSGYNPEYLKLKPNGRGYELTEKGQEKAFEHAQLGGTQAELAGLFGVTQKTISLWSDETHKEYKPEFADAWKRGHYYFVAGVRESQFELSKVNAAMAIHLGKHYLGQNDKPVEHHHLHKVVGTLPDYEQGADDWAKNFAPDAVNQIEEARRIEMDVEEAEIIDNETGEGS